MTSTAKDMRSGESLRERRRRRLVAELERIALGLFAERGYDSVTVEEIAAAADISPRTFFRYFANKEDVLLANERRRAEELRETFDSRPPDEPGFIALRNAYLSRAARIQEDREKLLLRAKVMAENPTLRDRDTGYVASLVDSLVISVAVRLGTDPATDLRPRVMVTATLSAVHSAFEMWLNQGAQYDPVELIADAIDLVGKGLEQAGRSQHPTGGSRGKGAVSKRL